eukprot:GFYU01007478.1.p1 GENE.GFYU01007478.1~~GFYU01007478.1.p1  ORF type:complete len:502 (-),score=147.55 GFYU01007478.1:146-1651(-)
MSTGLQSQGHQEFMDALTALEREKRAELKSPTLELLEKTEDNLKALKLQGQEGGRPNVPSPFHDSLLDSDDDFVKNEDSGEDWDEDMIEEVYERHKQDQQQGSRPHTASRRRPESASGHRERANDQEPPVTVFPEEEINQFESFLKQETVPSEVTTPAQVKLSDRITKHQDANRGPSDVFAGRVEEQTLESMLGKLAKELDEADQVPIKISRVRPTSSKSERKRYNRVSHADALTFDQENFDRQYVSPYTQRNLQRTSISRISETGIPRPQSAAISRVGGKTVISNEKKSRSRPASATGRLYSYNPAYKPEQLSAALEMKQAQLEKEKAEKRKARARVAKVMAKQKKKEDDFARDLARQSRAYESKCVVKVQEANDFSKILQGKKSYRVSANRDHGLLRVDVLKGNEKLRDISLELFLREHRKLQTQVLEQNQVKPEHNFVAATGPLKRDPVERKNQAREELRVVLLETIQLTSKLKDQLDEMERKGGGDPYAFSPFEAGL